MNDRPESITTIARARCGCVKVAMSMYVGVKPPAAWMRSLMDAVADGCTLETVSTEYIRNEYRSRCDVCDPPVPEQSSLLEMV